MANIWSAITILSTSIIGMHNTDAPLPSESDIRQMLMSVEFKGDAIKLISFDTRLFPIYMKILNDSESNVIERGRIFNILSRLKSDRSQFLGQAVHALSDDYVRHPALDLIAQIGGESESAPVTAVLFDPNEPVSRAAATTLSAIGGRNSIVAFDVWLAVSPKRNIRDLRQHIFKCREALKHRFDDFPE